MPSKRRWAAPDGAGHLANPKPDVAISVSQTTPLQSPHVGVSWVDVRVNSSIFHLPRNQRTVPSWAFTILRASIAAAQYWHTGTGVYRIEIYKFYPASRVSTVLWFCFNPIPLDPDSVGYVYAFEPFWWQPLGFAEGPDGAHRHVYITRRSNLRCCAQVWLLARWWHSNSWQGESRAQEAQEVAWG